MYFLYTSTLKASGDKRISNRAMNSDAVDAFMLIQIYVNIGLIELKKCPLTHVWVCVSTIVNVALRNFDLFYPLFPVECIVTKSFFRETKNKYVTLICL